MLKEHFKKLTTSAEEVRMERSNEDQPVSEDEDRSDSEESATFDEAITPPRTREVSESPVTPAVTRRHRQESPPATRGRDDRRGRARDTAPDTRRAASRHPRRRLLHALREGQLTAAHDEDTPPRQQTSRGRREGGRSSRDSGRSDTPGPDSYRHRAPYVHVQLPANPRR
ncbi:uncharacterized protein LDX57_009570 [Aspergillus melleus]|uniref:uncharacterized protein n=1 Tax=Aspergillus melleus TaxID=138277 RepID=UPI001E8E9E26|nr:uncharacterized protein LDX57_009570 [Aspergillus melleus]KAH8431921.1 hypothetical protein LDX57_009570 [Aspergillus melleus]